MKATRKLFCMVVALMLACLLLTSCGGSAGGGNASSGNTSSSTSGEKGEKNVNTTEQIAEENNLLPLAALSMPLSEEKVNLSMWVAWESNYLQNPSEIAFNQKVEELTNVHMEYTAVPSASASEKFGILLASNDFPDIIIQNTGITYPGGGDKAVSDGTFIKLNDLVSNYMPNYNRLRNSNPDVAKETISDSGTIWCIYSLACGNDGQLKVEPPWTGLAIRQDWLDDLKLPQPKTILDWQNVLTQFKHEKGADAPLMLSQTGIIYYDSFLSAYGVLAEFYNDNGTVKYGPLEDGYKQYVELMADWYKQGLIDQNFVSNSVTVVAPAEYVANGRTGAHINIWGLMRDFYFASGQSTDENFMELPLQNPTLGSGETAQARFVSYYTKNWASITKSCKKPEIAAQWLDYFYTLEGMEYINFGIEGESYERTDDENHYRTSDTVNAVTDKSVTDAFLMYTFYDNFGLSSWERFNLVYDPSYLAARETWEKDGTALPMPSVTLTSDEGNEYNSLYADIKTLVQEKTAGFIMGTEKGSYDSFIQQVKDMNIQKCIDIQQAALDRYNAR